MSHENTRLPQRLEHLRSQQSELGRAIVALRIRPFWEQAEHLYDLRYFTVDKQLYWEHLFTLKALRKTELQTHKKSIAYNDLSEYGVEKDVLTARIAALNDVYAAHDLKQRTENCATIPDLNEILALLTIPPVMEQNLRHYRNRSMQTGVPGNYDLYKKTNRSNYPDAEFFGNTIRVTPGDFEVLAEIFDATNDVHWRYAEAYSSLAYGEISFKTEHVFQWKGWNIATVLPSDDSLAYPPIPAGIPYDQSQQLTYLPESLLPPMPIPVAE